MTTNYSIIYQKLEAWKYSTNIVSRNFLLSNDASAQCQTTICSKLRDILLPFDFDQQNSNQLLSDLHWLPICHRISSRFCSFNSRLILPPLIHGMTQCNHFDNHIPYKYVPPPLYTENTLPVKRAGYAYKLAMLTCRPILIKLLAQHSVPEVSAGSLYHLFNSFQINIKQFRKTMKRTILLYCFTVVWHWWGSKWQSICPQFHKIELNWSFLGVPSFNDPPSLILRKNRLPIETLLKSLKSPRCCCISFDSCIRKTSSFPISSNFFAKSTTSSFDPVEQVCLTTSRPARHRQRTGMYKMTMTRQKCLDGSRYAPMRYGTESRSL